jgi:hypothetical protein
LAHNPIGKINQLAMYSSRLLNSNERNYIITKRKALAMVYALHKFRHYMLGNMFTFYVDHMALNVFGQQAISLWQVNYMAFIIFGV